MNRTTSTIVLLLAFAGISTTATHGQGTPARDRWTDSLANLVEQCRVSQLPPAPIENKIREGRAKNRPDAEIFAVVKIRRDNLLRIRSDNRGTMPQNYAQRLFALEQTSPATSRSQEPEQSAYPETKQSSRQVPKRQSFTVETTEPHDAVPADVSPVSSPAPAQNNVIAKQIEKRIGKTDAKADRVMEKSIGKAEKRMEKMQKRVEKRAMKMRGAEK